MAPLLGLFLASLLATGQSHRLVADLQDGSSTAGVQVGEREAKYSTASRSTCIAEGMLDIDDLRTCMRASETLGLPYHKGALETTYKDRPSGCIRDRTDNFLRFNTRINSVPCGHVTESELGSFTWDCICQHSQAPITTSAPATTATTSSPTPGSETCIEQVLLVLKRGSGAARQKLETDAAALCQKVHGNTAEALPFASCITDVYGVDSQSGSGMAATFDLVKCVERAWRDRFGCYELFAPVDGQQRIVFIVDVSYSMREKLPGKSTTRLELMQAELSKVLSSLRAEQDFTIFAFNSDVMQFREGLVPGNAANIQAAIAWVQATAALKATNYERPLRQAFALEGVDAIHFLSDGEPTQGCMELSCLPLGTKTPIHTTLLMPGDEEITAQERARNVLQGMATATGGTFREAVQP